MIKAHVRYTIDCDYFFSEEEMKQIAEDYGVELTDSIRNWIEQDFYKVETRADNVLPQYSSDLEIQVND